MKCTTKWLCLTLAAAVLAGPGCEPAVIQPDNIDQRLGVHITPKSTWKASGSATDPSAAIDGLMSTAARADFRSGGTDLIIDLQEPCHFQMIKIDHGQSEFGHGSRIGVATSMAGRVYTERHVGSGTRRITYLSLPQTVLARYLRLRVVKPGRRPWIVAEVYLQ